MNTLKQSITLLVGLFCMACQSKPSAETTNRTDSAAGVATRSQVVADLEKQILALHDSVMPAMSDLIRLKKQVTQQLAEFDKAPASAEIRRQKEQALAVKAALDKADMSMMDWMNQYDGDTLARLNEQKALVYLKDQQQRVQAMSRLMRKSITDAQNHLK